MGLAEDLQTSVYPSLGQPLNTETILTVIANVQAITGTTSSTYSYSRARLDISSYKALPSAFQQRQPPDTSDQAPQEAVMTLILFAASLYVGRHSLNGIEDAIKRAIATDRRLELKDVFLKDGSVHTRVKLLVPLQLIYNGQYPYDGTYAYS